MSDPTPHREAPCWHGEQCSGTGPACERDPRWLFTENKRLVAEVERLRSWKAEASEVIAGWEKAHDALGQPGRLGESRSAASVAEVERLRVALRHLGTFVAPLEDAHDCWWCEAELPDDCARLLHENDCPLGMLIDALRPWGNDE